MRIAARRETFALAEAFTISRGTKTRAEVVVAEVTADGVTGRGECVPYPRYGESVDGVIAAIAGLDAAAILGAGLEGDAAGARAALAAALPAGAARNAVDCALWDWAAKRAGCRVWDLAGLPAPGPVVTAYTLSMQTPEAMHEAARRHAHRPLLKIKLGGAGDLERLRAVRAGAPAARIIVDANEGWSLADYAALAPELVALGVDMVEQPLPAGADAALAEIARPLPVCADESCHDRAGLAALIGRYDMINIKLDKTGGLTEALALSDDARDAGLAVMVGCMVGSSLAMAPAVLLAQQATLADLDGPLLLAADRAPGLVYDAAGVHPPDAALWG